MTHAIIAEAKRNLGRLHILDNECNARKAKWRKAYEVEVKEIQDKIWKLESKRNLLVSKYNKQIEGGDEQKKKMAEILYPAVRKHKRIVELMNVTDKDLSFTIAPYRNDAPPQMVLEVISKPTVKLQVYLIEQNKPKNKFALYLIGKSIFNEKLIKYPYDYGLHFNHYGMNIIKFIKEAPTKEELLSWMTKDKVLTHWDGAAHDAVEKEYLWVQENCNTKEWRIERLLADKYYYENGYSHGTATAEYRSIIKELKKLGVKITEVRQ